MEFLQDWRFWGVVINTSVTIICFIVLKFNDFKHLEEDVNEIKEIQKEQSNKIGKVEQSISYLQGIQDKK